MKRKDNSFIEYLNAVDDELELLRGRTSEQSELTQIAAAQENDTDPSEAAKEIIRQRKRCDVPLELGGRA